MPKQPTFIPLAILASLTLGAGCQTTTPTAHNSAAEPVHSPAPEATAFLWVKGIGCPLCVPSVNGPLTSLPGVENVHVDLATGKVTVALNPAKPASQQALIDAIDESGFTLDRVEMPKQ